MKQPGLVHLHLVTADSLRVSQSPADEGLDFLVFVLAIAFFCSLSVLHLLHSNIHYDVVRLT